MGKDEQLSAFQKHSFDDDVDWQTYLKGIEITSPDPAVLLRAKGRWWRKTYDPAFDLAWLSDVPKRQDASGTSTARDSASSAQQQQQQARPQQQQQPASGAADSHQQRLFMMRAGLVVMALVYIVSLVALGPRLQYLAYRWFMQLLLFSSAYAIIIKQGLPPLRPFSFMALQQYLSRIGTSSDFHNLALAFLFTLHREQVMAIIPAPAIPAFYDVLEYMSIHMKTSQLWLSGGRKLFEGLWPLKRDGQLVSAFSEIGAGVSLIITAVLGRGRNLLLTVAYWQLLKLRYHVGDMAAMHRQAWYIISQRTAPVQRLPIISSAIKLATNWFLSLPRQ